MTLSNSFAIDRTFVLLLEDVLKKGVFNGKALLKVYFFKLIFNFLLLYYKQYMKRETGPTLDFTETNIELTMLEKWDFLFKITAGK